MGNFKSKKIKRKFYSFSGGLIVALFLMGILSLGIIGALNKETTVVSDNWLPSVIIAEELNTATSDFRIAEISHVISQNISAMVEHEDRMEAIENRIESMFQEYAIDLTTNETDEELLAQARGLWEEYLTIHDEMITYSRNNDTEAAMNIMEKESEVLFDEVSSTFLQLVNFNKAGVDHASSEGTSIYNNTIIMVGLILLTSAGIFYKFKSLMNDIEITQEKLRESNEEALLSSKAKSNFLANMSHEIRTPMNAISGMTDIILRETKDMDIKEYALNIKGACDSLLAIINDVLDISKIESGKLEIIKNEYKLSTVLNDVLNIATNRLELKPLMFTTNFQHDLPDQLLGDDIRVKQIMVNIVNNAIKFTSEGHIAFDVSGEYKKGILVLKFTVTDTGIGISPENIDKLFIDFERINTTKNRNIEGTGLGLAISKRLCEMMNGQIAVTSEVGKGTTFSVEIQQEYKEYIPIAKIDKQKSILIFETRDVYRNSLKRDCQQLALEKVVYCSLQSELNEALREQKFDLIFTSSMYLVKVQEMLSKRNLNSEIILLADNSSIRTKYDYTTILLPANTISISNVINGNLYSEGGNEKVTNFVAPSCKVLIVDDNIVNLKVAQGLMKPYEFVISTAENGKEAVEKIKNNKYDLVFMDHMMPIMDGIDATIAVRGLEEEYYQKLPIIALTANAIVGTKEMFIQEGMTDFLAKPIKIHALNDILIKWLPKEKQIFTDKNKPDRVEEENEAAILKIYAVDVNLGIKRTGGEFDAYLDILNMYYQDGVKRIASVQNFFDQKELSSYKIEVHALKSASASIGAIDISEKARLLEEASANENWVYLNQNTNEFIEDFNSLLEHIREALKGLLHDHDTEEKPLGDSSFYEEKLIKLNEALDNVDINLCEELLDQLFAFHWDEVTLENITKIKEFVSEYEYDEAIDFINEIKNC